MNTRYIKRSWQAFLALVLVLALCPVPVHAAPGVAVTRAIALMTHFESSGDYGCAHNDTNGLPSIGVIQWNGMRAITVLQAIFAADRDAARELLGDALYNRINGATKWSGGFTSAQYKALAQLLRTDAAKRVQDAEAVRDVGAYLDKGIALGIQDLTALVYYADILHQVGSGNIGKYVNTARDSAGGYGKITLKDLYQAAMRYATHTKARRQKAYEMLKADPVGGAPEAPVKETAPTGVALNGPIELTVGQTMRLTPELTPAGATTVFAWKSANKKVVTAKQGLLVARKAGKTKVAVRTKNGLVATVRVVVKRKGA